MIRNTVPWRHLADDTMAAVLDSFHARTLAMMRGAPEGEMKTLRRTTGGGKLGPDDEAVLAMTADEYERWLDEECAKLWHDAHAPGGKT